MKDSTHNASVIIVIILMVASIIALLVTAASSDNEEKDKICIKIGVANNLEFLFQSHGDCGWGVDCHYQCRFIDTNGKDVYRNVK